MKGCWEIVVAKEQCAGSDSRQRSDHSNRTDQDGGVCIKLSSQEKKIQHAGVFAEFAGM